MMRTRTVTYGDLADLMRQLGLAKHAFEVDRGRLGEEKRVHNGDSNGRSSPTLIVRSVRFHYEPTGAELIIPERPSTETLAPHHLHAARRTLVDWDVMAEADFEKWLCEVRFQDPSRKTTPADVTNIPAPTAR